VKWPADGPVRIYDLAHELAPGMPHHPNHPPYAFTLTKTHGQFVNAEGVSSAAELFTTGGHVGTHVDGLSHISRDGRVFGGRQIVDAQSYGEGVGEHPVHTLAPLIGAGHLVDARELYGRDLTPADGIDGEHFERWFAERDSPAAGSIVCVRTGWARFWGDNRTYLGRDTGLPGVTLSGARWLADHGVRATGADTVDYNQVPDATSAVHAFLLVDAGVPIMEMLNLEALASDRVYDFLFVAAALPLRGGTGSPIRPLAIVA
jgi:kynurenine formamidase